MGLLIKTYEDTSKSLPSNSTSVNTNLMKESLGGRGGEECRGFVCALSFGEDRRKRHEGIRNVVRPQMRMNGAGREREREVERVKNTGINMCPLV